jgi:hypothetical protein
MARGGGYNELGELDSILQELVHIKTVEVPRLPDLPIRVYRRIDLAIERVTEWRTKVAASGPQAGTSAPPQASPTTVAAVTVQAVPVASGSNVALSTGCGVAATSGQQVSLTPSAAPPATNSAHKPNSDGTAELQYLEDLVGKAKTARDGGFNELSKLDSILQELVHIKTVEVPRRPDLPIRVYRRIDLAIERVTEWRTKVAASGPPRVTSPSGPTSTSSSQQAIHPADETKCSYYDVEMEWEPSPPTLDPSGPMSTLYAAAPTAPAPPQLLLAQQQSVSAGPMAAPQSVSAQYPVLFAGPVVAASAPPPQLLPRQQSVLPQVVPLAPIATRIGRRPYEATSLRRYDLVAPRLPPLHPRPGRTRLLSDEEGDLLAPDAFAPMETVRAVRTVPQRRVMKAPAPPTQAVNPPAMIRSPGPSSEAVVEVQREWLEEWRWPLYDAVFGAAAALVVATGLGLVSGCWMW